MEISLAFVSSVGGSHEAEFWTRGQDLVIRGIEKSDVAVPMTYVCTSSNETVPECQDSFTLVSSYAEIPGIEVE